MVKPRFFHSPFTTHDLPANGVSKMSVDFRQRTPGELARMVWRRKWMILLPTAAIAVAVGYVVWRLPNVYESTTLLTVRPASIATEAVGQLSDSDLTLRINNI